jgi:predicted nuclease of predicted toxin-antitoxin system
LRIKTDENIGRDAVRFLRNHGHDVMTVREQDLGGYSDDAIFQVCCEEQRTLITLDRDFGNLLRFPPHRSAGIAIIDLGHAASLSSMTHRLTDFVDLATRESIDGKLWIVEPGRIRIHLEE